MKTLIILFSLLIIQSQSCSQQKGEQNLGDTKPIEYRYLVQNGTQENDTGEAKAIEGSVLSTEIATDGKTKRDTLLNHIQEKITAASNDGFATKSTKKLDEVEVFLTNNKIENENLKTYWIAYINYYKTIIGMSIEDEELAEEANEKGIEKLENLSNKNSDDYALLVLLKGMSYSFSSGMKAPFISRNVNKLLKKAIETDSTNFRVHYAQGSTDFYTPKKYGGGAIAESALLKAINLPEKNIDSSLPTWGKEEAYDLIIRFYLREDQKEKAKTYFKKAKQLFPNSYIIQRHQSRFKS